jgi:uncharacterized membrane protein HdeD (DUF308 family)
MGIPVGSFLIFRSNFPQCEVLRSPYSSDLWLGAESIEVDLVTEEEVMSTLALTASPSAAGIFGRSWWTLLLRGLLAMVLGVLIFTRPFITLKAVVLAFAFYCFVEGVSSLFTAISGWRHREHRWLLVMEGIAGIVVGLITLRTPGITTVALMALIAVWALVTGVLRIVEGVKLRREISGEVWLILGGLVSIAFAMLVLLRPFTGAIAVVRIVGAFGIFLGLTELFLAFEVRSMMRSGRQLLNSGRRSMLDTEVIDPAVDFDRKELHR